MRSRIPFLAPLALFLFLGCEQNPVEPSPADVSDTLMLMDRKPADLTEFDFSTSWDMCGYTTADCDLRFFLVSRGYYDATGGTHFSGTVRYHGVCTSPSTGETWIWNSGNNRQFQYNTSGQETEARIQGANWIGLGDAPNFTSEIKAHYTVNANGDEVTRHSMVIECVELSS